MILYTFIYNEYTKKRLHARDAQTDKVTCNGNFLPKNKTARQRLKIHATIVFSSAESELQVTVTKADFNRATMDRFCCLIAQSQCTTQCAGQVNKKETSRS